MAAPPVSTESRSSLSSTRSNRAAWRLLRGIVIAVVILAVALIFLGWKFRGFARPRRWTRRRSAARSPRPRLEHAFHPSAGALADRQELRRAPEGQLSRHVQRAAAAAARRRGRQAGGQQHGIQARRIHRAGRAVHRGAFHAVFPGVGGGRIFPAAPGVRPAAGVLGVGADAGQRPVLAVHALGPAADAHAAALQRGALRAGAGHRGATAVERTGRLLDAETGETAPSAAGGGALLAGG